MSWLGLDQVAQTVCRGRCGQRLDLVAQTVCHTWRTVTILDRVAQMVIVVVVLNVAQMSRRGVSKPYRLDEAGVVSS
jgi:hypothetical protein